MRGWSVAAQYHGRLTPSQRAGSASCPGGRSRAVARRVRECAASPPSGCSRGGAGWAASICAGDAGGGAPGACARMCAFSVSVSSGRVHLCAVVYGTAQLGVQECACVHAWGCICIHVHPMHMPVYIHTHACIHVCACIHPCAHMSEHTSMYMHGCTHVRAFVHPCMQVCSCMIHVCTHACTSICMPTCMCNHASRPLKSHSKQAAGYHFQQAELKGMGVFTLSHSQEMCVPPASKGEYGTLHLLQELKQPLPPASAAQQWVEGMRGWRPRCASSPAAPTW